MTPAAAARAWQQEGRAGALARAIDASGLGARGDDLLVVDGAGATVGHLLEGVADAAATAAAQGLLGQGGAVRQLVDLTVGFDAAVDAGLTCGGQVQLLVQRLDDVPGELWDAVARRRPVTLVSRLDREPGSLLLAPEGTGGAVIIAGTLGHAELDRLVLAEAARIVSHTGHRAEKVEVDGTALLVEAWNPIPHVVLVGASHLADALAAQVALLGWTSVITTALEDTLPAVEALGPADALVVLEHRPSVATAAFVRALAGGVGYIGALGSRRTQEARRNALRREGVDDDALGRIHGPTGLDLGARTPAETAVSIVAEVISVQSRRSAQSLRSTTTPISR